MSGLFLAKADLEAALLTVFGNPTGRVAGSAGRFAGRGLDNVAELSRPIIFALPVGIGFIADEKIGRSAFEPPLWPLLHSAYPANIHRVFANHRPGSHSIRNPFVSGNATASR